MVELGSRRQGERRRGSVGSRGPRTAGRDDLGPQRLARRQAGRNVNERVPEPLQGKHHAGGKVQTKEGVVRSNKRINSVDGRRDPRSCVSSPCPGGEGCAGGIPSTKESDEEQHGRLAVTQRRLVGVQRPDLWLLYVHVSVGLGETRLVDRLESLLVRLCRRHR